MNTLKVLFISLTVEKLNNAYTINTLQYITKSITNLCLSECYIHCSMGGNSTPEVIHLRKGPNFRPFSYYFYLYSLLTRLISTPNRSILLFTLECIFLSKIEFVQITTMRNDYETC